MARITLRISDDDLAAIDAEAGGNRSRFLITAARAAIERLRRERLDREVGGLPAEEADLQRGVLADFDDTLVDGLVTRGEVYEVDLNRTNGSEQRKSWPRVIVQRTVPAEFDVKNPMTGTQPVRSQNRRRCEKR